MYKNKKPAEKLWAILSRDKNGNEGICVLDVPGFGPTAAVTMDERRRDTYELICSKPSAQHEMAKAGLVAVVAEFTRAGTRVL